MTKFIVAYLFLIVSLAHGEIVFAQNLPPSEITQVKEWLHGLQVPESLYVKVSIHRKEDKIAAIMAQYHRDSLFAQKVVAKYWPSDIRFFIDTIAQLKKGTNVLNGLWLCFEGDSSSYTKGYYKNNVKDSLWIRVNMYTSETFPYKNGLLEGESLLCNKKGALLVKSKYIHGSKTDTAYVWRESGTIQKKKFYKEGNLIWEKCFTEKGKERACDLEE